MAKLSDPWNHHDWSSRRYVSQWAKRQDQREVDRQDIFQSMAKLVPYDRQASIRILDLGAGYGALAQFLLNYFPNAMAVCQDGSSEMAKLGRERMKPLRGRIKYVLCDFSKPGWSRKIEGPFEAVVSSIAIHNVRSPDVIRAIYDETFSLVRPGGCFLNFDRMTPSLKEQMKWLREAGFDKVKSFRDDGRRALVGGFRQ
ncbi:MAG: class I SAM-dependent methyltransferase [Candidatus Binatia bacterium]